MHKFCCIHNSQWHYNVLSFWQWNALFPSQYCRAVIFFKTHLSEASMLCLSSSNSYLFLKTQFRNFPRKLPRPPSHLPTSLYPRLLSMPLPYALTVPDGSLYFSTCYTVALYCHCLSFPHLCSLRLWYSWGQKTTLLPVVSMSSRLSGCSTNNCWMDGLPSFPFSRYWWWRPQMQFLSYIKFPNFSNTTPSQMPFLLWMCIVGDFL